MTNRNSRIAAVLCMILGTNVGWAQGWYLSANVGYGFGSGTQTIGYNSTYSEGANSSEGVYGSFGEGFKFGASVGDMVTTNLVRILVSHTGGGIILK